MRASQLGWAKGWSVAADDDDMDEDDHEDKPKARRKVLGRQAGCRMGKRQQLTRPLTNGISSQQWLARRQLT